MRRMNKPAIFGILALVGMSACQKSACDYSPSSNRTTAAGQMVSCVNSLPVTPTADMPTSGTANYTGFMVGDVNPAVGASDAIIGNASLTAQFGTNSVNGSVTNVSSSAHGALAGNLSLSGGTIVTNLVTGLAVSTPTPLTGYDGETISISGSLDGGFVGENADGILLGTGLGSAATVTFSSSAAGTADLTVFGLK